MFFRRKEDISELIDEFLETLNIFKADTVRVLHRIYLEIDSATGWH